MIWPQLETVAQTAIGHFLNSLPEGLLIAGFAWMMLRLLPRQNSGTRFAVWFVALLAVVGLPLIGGFAAEHSFLAVAESRPLMTLSGRWGVLFFLTWVLAATVAIFRLAVGLWHLRGLRRSCTAIGCAELAPAMRETIANFRSSRLPIARSVMLASSERVSVPTAIGFFKPMIVLPAWALGELSADELNVILLHEFAHLRRWDDWTNLLQKVVRAIFLLHPAVWWIESRLSLEREMACDDQVLAATENPRGYAKCLIALLEKSFARRGWAMAQAAVHRAREASLRLAQILDVSRPNTQYVWKPALGLVGVFSVVCLMVAPRAPQFVAFEHRAGAVPSADVQSVGKSQSEFPSAIVIPAAMHVSSSSSFGRVPQKQGQKQDQVRPVVGHIPQHIPQHRRVVPQVISAEWSAKSERTPVGVGTANATQTTAPAPETLLLIRTSERVGPNSWVWSVSVWRVTWTNPGPEAAGTASIAKKT